jgi:hypothetical protein
MGDAANRVPLTPGLLGPGMMPPAAGPLRSATPPSPLPIPQIADTSRSTTAPTSPICVLLADDNHHHRIPLIRALRKPG